MPVDPAFGLRSLATVARALSTSMVLQHLLETAALEARVALRAASVSIGRLEQERLVLRVLVNVGDLALTEERFPEDETYPLGKWGTARRVMIDGITTTSRSGDGECDPAEAELLEMLGKGSSIEAAIRVDGTIWGELYATRHIGHEPFVDDAVDYVDVLASIVGAAISWSVRESELAYLAFHDGLSGALNRRGLDEAAADLFEPVEGTSRIVTVVALDINGLKQVNDLHGHARGDELITTVAQSLHDAFTAFPGSLVARVGGDEFLVMVPGHDLDLVVAAVEAVCERTDDDDGIFGPDAGISAGIASGLLQGLSGPTRSELLASADRALYLAKRHQTCAVVVGHQGSEPQGHVLSSDSSFAGDTAGLQR